MLRATVIPCLSPVLSTGPKRLFATIKTEESGRYNLVECIKLSPDGKFKIFVPLKNGLNWLNFEFCRVVRHLVVNCSSKYAQVEQSHKIKLVYIVSSDTNGEFQVSTVVFVCLYGRLPGGRKVGIPSLGFSLFSGWLPGRGFYHQCHFQT